MKMTVFKVIVHPNWFARLFGYKPKVYNLVKCDCTQYSYCTGLSFKDTRVHVEIGTKVWKAFIAQDVYNLPICDVVGD